MPRTVEEVRQLLLQKAGVAPAKIEAPQIISFDYRKFSTEELQAKYDRMEFWLKKHDDKHPKYAMAKMAFNKMNKELASRS